MNEFFLVVWSGGYEMPSYSGAPDLETAKQVAQTYHQDAVETDTIQILRVDTVTMAVEVVEDVQ